MNYKVIRKNHSLGRVWEEGEIVELDACPNHHFEQVPEAPTVTLNRVVQDPMKATVSGVHSGEPTSFSQAGTKVKGVGVFAGAPEHEPLTPKTMKKKK